MAPERIFYVLFLGEKLGSIHKLLKPLVGFLNFPAQNSQIFCGLLELNNPAVLFWSSIWLLYHREDSNHLSSPLTVRTPSEAL